MFGTSHAQSVPNTDQKILSEDKMPLVYRNIHLNCKFEDLKDVEKEVVQLKMVIGLLIAKMSLDQRENIILELNNSGLADFAKQFTQFVLE